MKQGLAKEPAERRGFLKGLLGGALALLAAGVPAVTGLMAFLDPLRRRGTSGGAVRVGQLASLPADGIPRRFPVIADRVDAWNKLPRVPVGAIYLRRTAEDRIEALNVVCPHAGCLVDYEADRKSFLCPCHNSRFAIDGKVQDPSSPSPRPLDTLEVEVRASGEVWVKFRNFRVGIKEKVPA